MYEFCRLLLGTLVLRPYVFAFVACYLVLAVSQLGWRRTALFTAVAYSLALACEWSSAVAGTGFPFGHYRYLDSTRQQELWIAGVPFMDSLSFTFLSYVSWRVGGAILAARRGDGERVFGSWGAVYLGAALMLCLDLVIDPAALRGDRWFLGLIYYYPQPGPYFGVTLENFVGWFVVCALIVRTYLWLEERLTRRRMLPGGKARLLRSPWAATVLYAGVMLFNLLVTFCIREPQLALASTIVFTATLGAVVTGLRAGDARPARAPALAEPQIAAAAATGATLPG
jgi:putative membrane protein